MTHILPQNPDIGLVQHSSISSALEMEQQHQHHQPSPLDQHGQPQSGHSSNGPGPSRKRKKATIDGDENASVSEPRRLRRSHEACARCRSKKIKCDSKHPKCTACATSGVQCNQEDRHRKTLTPRGHTDRLERQLAQCQAILSRHYTHFQLDDLDQIIAREGIEVEYPSSDLGPEPFQFTPPSRPYGAQDGPPTPGPPKTYGYPPPHMMPPGYPHMALPPGYPPPYMGIPYNPHIHPAFQHIPPPPVRTEGDIKGQDPQANDMSNDTSLAKNFGVSAQIVNDLKLSSSTAGAETEDLAVGSGGLSSGRDREVTEGIQPREPSIWVKVEIQIPLPGYGGNRPGVRSLVLWLPKDRKMTNRIVDIYFSNLNLHRPVFNREYFENILNAFYDRQAVNYDPGFICSMYLIFALGTMSELNKAAAAANNEVALSPMAKRKLLPSNWPEYEEFFQRALAVKPDLRVTTSSLQALILLHWYLYTERQQRSLWRLVGSLVRLSVELGLHHDPYGQDQTFTEEECQLRIRLWAIVMVHDRGTSILLGRPLAISPADSNTKQPARNKNGQLVGFSEHFLFSAPVADIQADIVNSLYSPTMHGQDYIMRQATRIIKSMVEFRRQLPDAYKLYFGGTEDWSIERKRALVDQITENQGLTLLKIGIARILLLRALFSSKELPYPQRHRALMDAIVTSHNIIATHAQLIRFHDIAFFVSPIPLHIAAMVILFGQMSKCDVLTRETAIEDIWTALDMLPRFRWHWERRDMGGAHPLIERVAEKVLEINLNEIKRTAMPVLMPEEDWESGSPGGAMSPTTSNNTITSPTHAHSPYSANHGGQYGGGGGAPGNSTVGSTSSAEVNGGKQLAEVPTSWFWPMDPQNPIGMPVQQAPTGPGQPQQYYYQPIGAVGCQPSQDSYMLEEKDPTFTKAQAQAWVNNAMNDNAWSAIAHAHHHAQAAHMPSHSPQSQRG